MTPWVPTVAESTTPLAAAVVEGDPEVVVDAVVVVDVELVELQAARSKATNAVPVATPTRNRRCAVQALGPARTALLLMHPSTAGLPITRLCAFPSMRLSSALGPRLSSVPDATGGP